MLAHVRWQAPLRWLAPLWACVLLVAAPLAGVHDCLEHDTSPPCVVCVSGAAPAVEPHGPPAAAPPASTRLERGDAAHAAPAAAWAAAPRSRAPPVL